VGEPSLPDILSTVFGYDGPLSGSHEARTAAAAAELCTEVLQMLSKLTSLSSGLSAG